MKNAYLILLVGLFFVLSSFSPPKQDKMEKATEPAWLDWNTGFAKAAKEKKIILVDVFTDWCGWCKRMDKDTYADKEILKTIEDKFIPIKFNPETEGVVYQVDELKVTGAQLLNMLTSGQRTGFPTIIFIYPNVREVVLQPGYQDAKQFKASLEQVVLQAKAKAEAAKTKK